MQNSNEQTRRQSSGGICLSCLHRLGRPRVLETSRWKMRESHAQFTGLILQMGKERSYTADSFVMCKPHPGGPLGCHPVSAIPGHERPGRGERIPAGAHPRRRPARSRRSRPSARLRLSAQVCKQWSWREGAAANFRAARRGGTRPGGRRDQLTGGGEESRGAEEHAAERGQQAGARHAVGTRARTGRFGRAHRGALAPAPGRE